MMPWEIHTSPVAGQLLQRALAQQGVAADQIHFRQSNGSDGKTPPLAVVVQPGGLKELQQLGVDVETLARQGWRAPALRILDASGASLVTLETEDPQERLAPLWIAPAALAACLATREAPLPAAPRPALSAASWQQIAPGILLQRRDGCLVEPATHLVWDTPAVHIGLTHLAAMQLVCYAIPKYRPWQTQQGEAACRAAIAQVPDRLRRYLRAWQAPAEEQWYPALPVGWRAPIASSPQSLQWGHTALALHPLTGQEISYWAIQACQVATAWAQRGTLSAGFLRHLQQQHRRLWQDHIRTLDAWLDGSWWRAALQTPYLRTLRYCRPLRARRVRALTFMAAWPHRLPALPVPAPS